MKEAIEKNYNISIDHIIETNGIFTFSLNEEKYIFSFFNRSISELRELIDCCNDLSKLNIKTLRFMPNAKWYIVTKINDDNYVLLKVMNNYKDIVDFDEILENNKKLAISDKYQSLYRNNWASLWSEKLDYYEYQIHELGKDKDVILNSFGYYEGLATNAIALVNACQSWYNANLDKVVFSHRRIFFPNYCLNYYNPLNFIFDLEVRDVAEYIKTIFFHHKNAFLDLVTYLKSTKMTSYSAQMLYARLLYPSYYFDIYDTVMNKSADQEELINIIKEVDNYELFLKKAYLEISKYAHIDNVSWITQLEEH